MATTATPPPPSSPSSSSSVQQQHHSALVCKPRPLMLKDFLREDQNSDSFGRRFAAPTTPRWGAGAASANTVRYLLTLELNNAVGGEKRKAVNAKAHHAAGCSGGNYHPLAARLSAVINALKMLPFSNSSSGGSRAGLTTRAARQPGGGMPLLPRSLSKRLRRSFWRKCADRDRPPCRELASRKILVRDIMRRASLDDDNKMGGWDKVKAASPPPPPTLAPPPPTTTTTPRKEVKQIPAATSSSTAGSSPARASCSTSTSTSTSNSASSWSELDSDSSSRSGSESVGSSSSPVPEFANPVLKPAAASLSLATERKRDGTDVAARRTAGGGSRTDSMPAPAPTQTGHRYSPEVQGADGEGDVGMRFACVQYEEKDQLSPVAVVDFPSSSEDEEEENDDRSSRSDDTQSTVGVVELEEVAAAADQQSAAFHQRLASLERVKHRLLWKIQKFETLAAGLVEPVEVDLAGDAETAESAVEDDETDGDDEYECCEEGEGEDEEATTTWTGEEEEEGVQARARELLDRLKASWPAADNGWGLRWNHEVLLLDLFIQGLWEHDERTRSSWRSGSVATTATSRCFDDGDSRQRVEEGLLSAARGWLQASPRRRRVVEVDVGSKAALIRELDRNGPWGRCLDTEEGEVVAALADRVLDSVLAELLLDMLTTSLFCC